MMTSEKNKNLKEILTVKLDLFNQLLKLTLMQKEESGSGNSLERIDIIAAEKESIYRKIEEMDKMSKPVDMANPTEELKPLVAKVRSVIFDILKVEDEVLINMEKRKNEVGEEIRELGKGKTILKGYGISTHLKSGILSIKK